MNLRKPSVGAPGLASTLRVGGRGDGGRRGARAGGEAGALPAEHLVLITVPHLSFMLLK